MLVVYGGLIYVAYNRLATTPTGLIPQLDRGYLIAVFQLPPGASLARTDAVIRRASAIILQPAGRAEFGGLRRLRRRHLHQRTQCRRDLHSVLKPFAERVAKGLSSAGIARRDLRQQLAQLDDAFSLRAGAALGAGHRHRRRLEALCAGPRRARVAGARAARPGTVAGTAAQTPGFTQAFTLFNTHTPQIYADIDRTKAELLQVPIARVFETLSVYMGSVYINDFNLLGRTYQVAAQADNPFRLTLARRREPARRATSTATWCRSARSPRSATPPARSACRATTCIRRPRCSSSSARGFSSGQAITAVEQIAHEHLPPGFGFEWTEIALQEKLAGNTAMVAFGLAVVFVFLLLAALYESWLLPLAVILIVPMCILAAMLGVNVRGLDRNILVEIGLVVLVGLAAKNAILIVEFAKQAEDRRHEPVRCRGRRGAHPAAADPDDLARLHPRASCRWPSRSARAPRCASRWAPPYSPACWA